MTTPRKCRLDLATPPEVALREALAAVEALPADTRLTNAGQKIVEAMDLVGDYVNDQMRYVGLGGTRSDAKRAWDAVRSDRQPQELCARCGHSWSAHCGHTTQVGHPEPHHCSQLCGCGEFLSRSATWDPIGGRPIR